MTRILISGSYGTGNVGDEVILKYILSTLEGNEVIVLSQGVDYTKKYFLHSPVVQVIAQTPSWRPIRILKDIVKMRWGNISQRIRFLREVSKCDIFWVGGGGLFAELVPTVLEFYLHQIKWASFFKKKIVIMGVGVGPLRTERGIQNIVKTFQKIPAYIGVRDQQSQDNLTKNGVTRKIKVSPDFAFLTPIKEVTPSENKKKIVFNFYAAFSDPILHPDGGARFEQLQKGIIAITRDLLSQGYEVTFLPFGTKNDLTFAKMIEAKVDHPQCQTFESDNYQEIIDELASAYFSITMRFHAGLLSLLNNVPSLCIDQQFKSERLLKDFGQEELLYSLPDGHHKEGTEDLTLEKMKPKIEYLLSHYEEIRQSFNRYHSNCQGELNEDIRTLKTLFSQKETR